MAYNRNFGYLNREFIQSDLNHDGRLDRNEFRNWEQFNNADFNRDGYIGLNEFAIGAG